MPRGIVKPGFGLGLIGRFGRLFGCELSLVSQDDVVTVNGRSYSSHDEASSDTTTQTSPKGRTATTIGNSAGKITQRQVPGLAGSYGQQTNSVASY